MFPHSRQSNRIKAYELILTDASLGIEVYANLAGTSVMAFSGNRSKPTYHLAFDTPALAFEHVRAWHKRLDAALMAKLKRKEERKTLRRYQHEEMAAHA